MENGKNGQKDDNPDETPEYAYQDKLSGKCEYALYDAAVQLERAVAALTYVVNECGDDLEKHCSSVPVGEGRLFNCLEKNNKIQILSTRYPFGIMLQVLQSHQ
jgi:hypothetical protein